MLVFCFINFNNLKPKHVLFNLHKWFKIYSPHCIRLPSQFNMNYWVNELVIPFDWINWKVTDHVNQIQPLILIRTAFFVQPLNIVKANELACNDMFHLGGSQVSNVTSRKYFICYRSTRCHAKWANCDVRYTSAKNVFQFLWLHRRNNSVLYFTNLIVFKNGTQSSNTKFFTVKFPQRFCSQRKKQQPKKPQNEPSMYTLPVLYRHMMRHV